MRTIRQKHRVYTHMQTSLMEKVQITDRRRPDCNKTSTSKTTEDPSENDACPGRAVACCQVHNGCEEIAEEVDGSAAVHVGDGDYHKRPDGTRDDERGQLV